MTAVSKQTLYDYFCSGGSASNSISTLESELEDLIDTFYGTWTDYSDDSTIVGWSAYTTQKIYYKIVGKLVFVQFDITGTSDSTSTTFTLPYTQSNYVYAQVVIRIQDNTQTPVTGIFILPQNSATIDFYSTLGGGGWTASGTKSIYGQFWYEAA